MDEQSVVAPAEVDRRGRVRRHFGPEDRERLLDLLDRSGQSVRQFCREHDVAQSSLAKWRRLRRQGRKPVAARPLVRVAVASGIEVPPCSRTDASSAAVMIRMPGGAELEARVGSDVEWLGALCQRLLACSR